MKKEGGKSNQISRDDCEAITSKSKFRYSSPAEKAVLVYPIDNVLVPVHHLDSGRCSVLEAIDLDKEVSEFTYSSDDLPINPEESFEVIGSFDHRHNFLDTIMMMDLKRPADGSERCC